MTAEIRDYLPLLKVALAEARTAGFESELVDLEAAVAAAYTTSSEMLQEHGRVLGRFLQATRKRLPSATLMKLEACLTETELACSDWRRPVALLRRKRYAVLFNEPPDQ